MVDKAVDAAMEISDGYQSRSQFLSSIARSLVQFGKIGKAIGVAKTIDDGSYRSQLILQIILVQLEFEKRYSKDLLNMITIYIGNSLFNILSNSLNVDKDLWNYTIIKCMGYPEIAYSICSLIAKSHPENAKEIANLILEHKL